MVDQINQLIKHKSVLEIQGSVLQHEITENSGRMSFDQEQQVTQLDGTVEHEPDGRLLGDHPSPKRVDEANLVSQDSILGDEEFQTKLNVVSGLIQDDESQRLLKLLYRVSRGKVACFFKEVGANQLDIVSKDDTRKTVFVLVFEDNKQLESRVLKICQSFTNHTYVMPKGFTRQLRYQKIVELQREITNSLNLLQMTRQKVREYLIDI